MAYNIEDEGGERGNSGVSGGASTGGVTIYSAEEEERRRGVWVVEAAIAETTALRRGYTMSAAWDEGAMMQAIRCDQVIRHPSGGAPGLRRRGEIVGIAKSR